MRVFGPKRLLVPQRFVMELSLFYHRLADGVTRANNTLTTLLLLPCITQSLLFSLGANE